MHRAIQPQQVLTAAFRAAIPHACDASRLLEPPGEASTH